MNTGSADRADLGLDFRKSGRSMANGNCVEVAVITIPTTAA